MRTHYKIPLWQVSEAPMDILRFHRTLEAFSAEKAAVLFAQSNLQPDQGSGMLLEACPVIWDTGALKPPAVLVRLRWNRNLLEWDAQREDRPRQPWERSSDGFLSDK